MVPRLWHFWNVAYQLKHSTTSIVDHECLMNSWDLPETLHCFFSSIRNGMWKCKNVKLPLVTHIDNACNSTLLISWWYFYLTSSIHLMSLGYLKALVSKHVSSSHWGSSVLADQFCIIAIPSDFMVNTSLCWYRIRNSLIRYRFCHPQYSPKIIIHPCGTLYICMYPTPYDCIIGK